ncbi:hypothetical protein [Neisseria chenwenguii]|uniref:Uncharacterized protein n=1 Tax=Neisseria chenwenguii TaxID=1853278 RepID=A0A220S0Z6_9NEIS|nr:hypothetical protein [Neisseria chenwenguii]ASK26885.1 hypothetical protein BG910_03225 [Neisseria chenwenguii]ROV56860.1 hypothetical protein EGS38_03225 [Neisseria chenwenguii]
MSAQKPLSTSANGLIRFGGGFRNRNSDRHLLRAAGLGAWRSGGFDWRENGTGRDGDGVPFVRYGAAKQAALPVTQYENFLPVSGSIFAPMAAVLIADYFVLKHDVSRQLFDFVGLVLWLAGFVLYRNLMTGETPLGMTFPVMAAVFVVTVIVRKLAGVRGK